MLYQIDANVFYDNITGFIGIYGTHRLTAFVCFLLLLNINLIKEKGMKQTGFLIVNTVLILASTLWISSKNDNTAMYIFIPLTLILYFVNAKKVTLSTLFKVSMLVLVAIVIFSQLMKVNEIRFFFESRLISKIEGFLAFFSTGRIEEERYAYIDYALQWLNGKSIGIGIGRVKLVGDPIISSSDVSLRNWGMSNMASFIAAGGLVFTFIYILIYTYIVIAPQKNKKLFISLSIIFLALFYYGQTATSIPMVTFVWMMLYPFFIGKKDFKFSEADEGDNSI